MTQPHLFATVQNCKNVDYELYYIITLLKDVVMNHHKSIEFCDIGPSFGDCAELYKRKLWTILQHYSFEKRCNESS